MKQKYTLLTVVATSLGLLGCSPNKETPPTPTAASTNVSDQLKPAADATKDSAAAMKDKFLSETDKQLSSLDAQIAELRKKTETLKDDAKTQADQALASLSEQREKLKVQYDKLKAAGADTWNDVKAGFASAMDELDKAFQNTKAKLN
jgi:hypothetical protein